MSIDAGIPGLKQSGKRQITSYEWVDDDCVFAVPRWDVGDRASRYRAAEVRGSE